MTRFYDEMTDNNDGAVFPLTRAINSSGPLIPDGTEIIRGVIDDVWLEKQALLYFYDYPPFSIEDAAGLLGSGLPFSQPLAVQYMNYATPGTIVNWASEIDPVILGATLGLGMEIRLLLLHGQGIDRTLDDFKMLDTIVYVGDPDNATADAFYHADDSLGAVRNPAGDYLILPDARGYSFRALDPSGLIDPDGAGRIVGSTQEDAFQNITGDFYLRQKTGSPENVIFGGIGSTTFSLDGTANFGGNSQIQSTTPSGPDKLLDRIRFDAGAPLDMRTSTETRAKNIATHFAIHY